MKRRDLLKLLGSTLLATTAGRYGRVFAQAPESAAEHASKASAIPNPGGAFPDVVMVENGEPTQLLTAALKEMGGMERFVKAGDVVVVKPNIGWDRSPEQAGDTNPDLVAEVVKRCLEAGAKKVRIFDHTCNTEQRCYLNSGIQEKAETAGAEVSFIDQERFKMTTLKKGKLLQEWPIYQDYLEADKVINVPIAKHHGLARVTLGLKNLMGVMGGARGEIHSPFSKLIDITAEILPTLTIIDAYRMLMAHGPQGGNLEDVKTARALVMSPCTVAADHTALRLFDLTPADVPYLQEAADRGLNRVDLKNLQLKKVKLS